jgi:peptide/nickel transport system substrate-binding protein
MRRYSRSLRSLGLSLALLTSACPEEPDRARLSPEPSPRAGTLRLGYPEEPPSLNPVTDPSPASRDLLRPVLPSFYLVTPELEYRPYLLSGEPEVRREPDRMTVCFRIRDDATWSDDRPITVDDVRFTWRVMTQVDAADPEGFDHLVAVEEDSPRVGRLVLRPPLASWRDLFSAGRFVLPAHAAGSPSQVAEWQQGPPVTAGPFRLERWTRGRSVTLVADPSFWGPAPGVERIEVAFVPDPTTALQLLERGSLDAVAAMAGISWGRRLDAVPGVTVSRAVGPDLVHLMTNTESLPSTEVRRRIVDGIDRDRLVEVVLRDEAITADGVLAPEIPGAVPAWEAFGRGPPRPAAAVPGELDLVYVRAERTDLVARYLQAELERINVDVELVPLESDVFHGIFVPERRFDLALWELRSAPSADLWPWVEVPGAAPPVTGLSQPDVAGLASGAAVGGRESGRLLIEAQTDLAELAPVLPLYQPLVTVGWRAGVAGPAANPTVDGPLWNAETWRVGAS